MLNEKTVENSNGRMLLQLIRQLSGGAISSVASFHVSSRLWIPHQVIGCKLSSQQQTLKNLIKFWKEQCKHLQVQWSCYHGHNGECTACTKRTAQASFRHKKEQCKHLQDKISFWGCRKMYSQVGVSLVVHGWLASLATCSLIALALFVKLTLAGQLSW